VKLLRASIVLSCACAYVSFVFRVPSGDFLRAGLGDWVDPYFINALLEHWRYSLSRFTDPASPLMYFPVRGTLGYSHGLILYAPVYVALRFVLPPFQSYNLTLLVVVLGGSLLFYVFVRRIVRLAFFESLVLTAFFCTSRNVINGGSGAWSQRLSVFLIVPIMLLFAIAAGLRPNYWKHALGWSAGFLAALLFTQDFYTAQLALLVAGLLGIGLLIVSRSSSFYQTLHSAWQAAGATVQSGVSVRPSRWWLITTCLLLLCATIVLLHPFTKTQVGSIPISASDPTRPFLIAVFTGAWFGIRLFRIHAWRDHLWQSSLDRKSVV